VFAGVGNWIQERSRPTIFCLGFEFNKGGSLAHLLEARLRVN